HDWQVSPVGFVSGALGDPALQDFDLAGRRLLAEGWRRHDERRLAGGDARVDGALLRATGRDSGMVAKSEGSFRSIEAEVRLTRSGIGSVAAEAVLRQDRADVAVVADLGGDGLACRFHPSRGRGGEA